MPPTMTSAPPSLAVSAPTSRHFREHSPWTTLGAWKLIYYFKMELIRNLPGLLRLRAAYRTRRRTLDPHRAPIVLWIGDNLDEVNGIALSSRLMIRKLREKKRDAFLLGVAFHSKPPRSEGPDNEVVLLQGRYSLAQAGYATSELAIPRLDKLLAHLQDRTVDLIEFQTPGPVAVMALIVAKIAGIPTLSHYRTDILTYAKVLIRNRAGIWAIQTWTKFATRFAGPVIVPSEAYRHIMQEIGVAPNRIHKLSRGVDLQNFHPDKAAAGTWERRGLPLHGIRLLYVGRVSREKNLELLTHAFPKLLGKCSDLTLTIVGDGPYREEMERALAKTHKAFFTGMVEGAELPELYAAADLFVFPSLTDTFGNSVAEALASGLPCITSDSGGPQEIIEDGESGVIFSRGISGDFEAKILELVLDVGRLQEFKSKARKRALQFTYEHAADDFWNFYLDMLVRHSKNSQQA